MKYSDKQRTCAICQSSDVTAATWDNVPLCETHWRERESMQLGSDQLFRRRTPAELLQPAVQEEERLLLEMMSEDQCA